MPEFLTFIMAMLPISELRGALPLGICIYGIPWWQAFAIAVLGNLALVPILLIGSKWLLGKADKAGVIGKGVRLLLRFVGRRSDTVKRYERMGLMVFVAIPLPMTGAWTGSFVASILGMGFKKAMLSIACGVVTAGVIVTCLCLLGWWGGIIAGFVLITATILWFRNQDSVAMRKQANV